MSDMTDQAHAEHLAQAQDHYRWRREQMEALAILKRAEAETARHEEQIAHSEPRADAPPADEHARFTHDHAAGAEHHNALLESIRALDAHIKT
jgi:hypothetical protein